MNPYDFLVQTYGYFINIFPTNVRWLVSLLILVGIIGAFVELVKKGAMILIPIVIFVPLLIPVISSLAVDAYHSFVYVVTITGLYK